MNSAFYPAHTQHIFDEIGGAKKPENTDFKGVWLVEAAGIEPASGDIQLRLLHAYPEL